MASGEEEDKQSVKDQESGNYSPPGILETISTGFKYLWEYGLLLDYTIKVEAREFRVHKTVMAAGSKFFWAMLNGQFKESTEDMVELKSLGADAMAHIVKYMYTGEMEITFDNCSDILACAVHLLIDPAINECCKFFYDNMALDNFVDILAMDQFYTLYFGDWVRQFMYENAEEIVASDEMLRLLPENLSWLIEDYWVSEFDRVEIVNRWVAVDPAKRLAQVGEVLEMVRFSLIPREELTQLSKMRLFTDPASDGKWKDLVKEAMVYQHLPIWKKVTKTSKQSEARTNANLVVFTTSITANIQHCGSEMYILEEKAKSTVSRLENRYTWYKDDVRNAENLPGPLGHFVVVNNFLIVAGGLDPSGEIVSDKCHVFDPRRLRWYEMASMNLPRLEFTLVEADHKIYALGGVISFTRCDNEIPKTSECEVYDFETNTWSLIPKLKTYLIQHAACFYGGSIYVSGGVATSVRNEVCCFDISMNKWIDKAPMNQTRRKHFMTILTIHKKEAIVAIGPWDSLEYYIPAEDQWTVFTPNIRDTTGILDGFSLPVYGIRVFDSRSMFCIQAEENEDSPNVHSLITGYHTKCYRLTFNPQNDNVVIESLKELPPPDEQQLGHRKAHFSALLSLPPEM